MRFETIRLVLPVPPSLNAYWKTWRGRTVLSKEGRAYKGLVEEVAGGVVPIPPGVEVAITMDWYRAKRIGDLDNRLKCLLDALQGVAYTNDRDVVDIHARRFEDKDDPRVEVTARAIAW